VQDFSLVISCGDAFNTNGVTVASTANTPPFTAPAITFISNFTNGIYFDQLAGASAPWLSTNDVPFASGQDFATNSALFIGQTNQWHFFVVTNTTTFTNAAFIVFLPNTQATPRMGVFADSSQNPTRPEADLNLFVAPATALPPGLGDANAGLLTNLDYTIISNCVFNVNNGQASLARGGTKFVAYTNSVGQQVYYVGVQCQDQMAANFGFLAVFSQNPFSSLNPDGSQTVNGLLLPVAIPDGNNAHPGVGYCVSLALYPMQVGGMTVTNQITHQNFGDLLGILSHGNQFAVLNNHNGNIASGTSTTIYNDNGQPGTVGTDGPGSLRNFTSKEAAGPWIMTEVDDSETQTGSITGFTMNIQPHQDLTHGVTVTIQPGAWFYGYVDVPVGYTNILVAATNLPPTSVPPIQMYFNTNTEPNFTSYLIKTLLTNGVPPGNSISYGPPLQPGRYFVGLFNPDIVAHQVYIIVTLAFNAAAIERDTFTPIGSTPLLDDAVSYSYIDVTETKAIQEFSVGLRVDHPRISDLTFTLISPGGTRYLLMENRGGQSTNGAGATIITTNIFSGTASGGPAGATNVYDFKQTSGTIPISWEFYTVPDQMDVYYESNLIFTTGLVSGSGTTNIPYGPGSSTQITVVMDATYHPPATLWTYTIGGTQTNYEYLTFTEDTNLTTTPIKYAVPPFVPPTNVVQTQIVTNNAITWFNSFEGGVNSSPSTGTYFAGGWYVISNEVDWVTNGTYAPTADAYDGTNYIDLNGNSPSAILTNIPTVIGGNYILTFAYAHNPNAFPPATAQLSINNSNVLAVTPDIGNSFADLGWATTSVVFTATSPTTAIQMTSLSPGMSGVFLDAFSVQLVSVVTNNIYVLTNLYYLPEDDISGLIGTPANGTGRSGDVGTWTLEILDNRAGATNNAVLESWSLNITVANTNFTFGINTNLGNGAITNFIPGNSIQWYRVDVPINADWATNTLLFANLPLNLWWSTNVPPSTTNGSDVELFGSSTGGSSILGTNTSPAFIVPGGTYYLGVQNTNTAGTTYALQVTFHLLPVLPVVTTLPAANLDLTTATLRALVHPGFTPATVYFEYGTTTNLGTVSGSFNITNNLNFAQIIGIDVTNLLPETLYYFRAVATNSVGTNYGNIRSFFTVPLPRAQTLAATLVAGPSAQLNGFATPNANTLPTTAWFEWGTNRAYGNVTPSVNVGTGFAVVYTNAAITGLLTNVPYHFRLVVSNAQAVVYGFDQVLDQANVVAWGANFLGQLNVPAGLSNVVAVAGAYNHSLALKSSGLAVGWGENAVGQATVPANLTNLVGIAGGEYFSAALRANGTVAAWGANVFPGQTNVPVGLNNVVEIAAGRFATLALKSDGTITPWGVNFSGITTVPAGVTNVVSVAGGSLHNLALINNGTVVAWGDDGSGQTNVPVGLNTVVAVAAGALHSLALKYDGTVVAWGDNSDGQTNVPAGLTNVVAISAGGFHSMALRADGSIIAWGDNSTGQTTPPAGMTNVVAISSGNLHNLVLTPQSLFNLTNGIVLVISNGVPVTNNILPGAVTYYQVNVPTNADFATNTLLFANNGALNVWFSTNTPPTVGGPKDSLLLAASTNGVSILSTTSAPTNIIPGGTYYLGVQNTNSVTVNYGIQVDFHFTTATNPPAFTNFAIASIIYTNIGGSNGFLLTWFAPSNALFQVQWTASLSPASWATFTNIVSQNTNAPGIPPNAQFNFFDDGSQTGGFGPTRFYRLILLGGVANTLTLPTQTNLTVNAGVSVTVTNTATDSNTNAIVGYSLVNPPSGASINPTNGIITWTNAAPAGLAARFTTIAVDNGNPAATATNSFTVFVMPFPSITNVTVTATNTILSWIAPTNDVFQVQWATNLVAPINWTLFPGTITSTTGVFSFTDTNAPLLMKFYQLILLP
jgi:subtilisin-like proprotein convertase family protein